MKRNYSTLFSAILIVTMIFSFTFSVSSLETWDDPYEFYTTENTYITAEDPGSGNGNDVYGLWNTSSPLTGNFEASALVVFDYAQGDDVGQKASLLLGDDTDYDAGPQLVVLMEVFYFKGEGGKCIASFQYLYDGNWSTPISVNDWTTGLGAQFLFEVSKTSATTLDVKLTALQNDTILMDDTVTMDSAAIDMLKNYGVATRTGFEGFIVPAGETWDDPYEFYSIPDQAIMPVEFGAGNGNDVLGIWNVSTQLDGSWVASTNVTFNSSIGDDDAQKAILVLGDDTDYEAGPNLVALLEVFYFKGEGGKCIANFQYILDGNWNTPASVSDWTTGLGNEFYFEIEKVSATTANILLKALEPDTTLIDQTVDMGTALALIKNYGVATRTGNEIFTNMLPFTDEPEVSPTEEPEPTPTITATSEPTNPQTGNDSNASVLIIVTLLSIAAITVVFSKRIKTDSTM